MNRIRFIGLFVLTMIIMNSAKWQSIPFIEVSLQTLRTSIEKLFELRAASQ